MTKLNQQIAPYLLLLPFLLLFGVFVMAPLGYAFYLSLFRETMMTGTIFVGLGNYTRVFADPLFWRGVVTMLAYGAFAVPVMAILATALALLLDSRSVPMRGAFRLLFFIPYAVPGVIAALIWSVIYGPTFGPITQIAQALGLPPPPLLQANWVLLSIANIAIWELVGYKMVIVFAALKNIPPELEEASMMDGATGLQYALFIKVPLVVGAILLNVLFSIIGTLQLFNEPVILQSLAPGVITKDFTPNMYARTLAFTSRDVGYAGAVSFVLAFMIALVSSLVILAPRLRKR